MERPVNVIPTFHKVRDPITVRRAKKRRIHNYLTSSRQIPNACLSLFIPLGALELNFFASLTTAFHET
jgi:hypothetical protein